MSGEQIAVQGAGHHIQLDRPDVELRREAPGVSLILMTSWPAPGTRASVLQAGATAYLTKPWDDDSLVAMVQRLLGIPR